jgi:hypothetical protein
VTAVCAARNFCERRGRAAQNLHQSGKLAVGGACEAAGLGRRFFGAAEGDAATDEAGSATEGAAAADDTGSDAAIEATGGSARAGAGVAAALGARG